MKFNKLLVIITSGLALFALSSCGSSSSSSSSTPTLTPSATSVSNPAGTNIFGLNNSIPTGCSDGVCSIQIPTGGSTFESVIAPSAITSADQIYAAWYMFGNVAIIDTNSVIYVTSISSSVANYDLNLMATNVWLSATSESGISAFTNAAISGGSVPYVAGSTSLANGLVASTLAAESTAIAVSQSGASSCSSTSGVEGTAIALTNTPINSVTYAGVGLSNGQVCVANVTTQSGFQNLISSSTQAKEIYGNESSPVYGIAFYQSPTSTACAGYWYNLDGAIWKVNATCGSTISPTAFTKLSSSTSVSGTIPQHPTAIYVGAANGLYIGGYTGDVAESNSVPVIYYLTPGTNAWTSVSINTIGIISNISPTTSESVVYATVCPNLASSASCSGYNVTLH